VRAISPFFSFFFLLLAAGCDCGSAGGGSGSDDDDFPWPDGGPGSDSGADDGGAIECEDGRDACAGECCDAGDRCAHGACIPDVPCASNDECQEDSWCEDGACTPYGSPEGHEKDEDCNREVEPAAFEPALQCAFSTPPADQVPSHVQVMSTPVVLDLDLDLDPDTLRPSVVFNTFAGANYGGDGVLRIVDGRTCEHQQSLIDAADRTIPAASPSLGDLDGDGRPEIVSPRSGGGLIAYAQDADGVYSRLWSSGTCDGAGGRAPDATGGANRWSGASIHDLDDDGVPEIVYGAVVYDAAGCILDSAQGWRGYSVGQVPVLADVDVDGRVEWLGGNAIFEFDAGAFVAEAGFVAAGLADGFVAVADFGDFGDGPGIAEIAVIASGWARVQTISGAVVFGPFTSPGLPNGGPPTIADFDGDGEPEFASAGGDAYVVFDLECDEDPLPAGCEARGVRWSQPSQDHSSTVTGSSVFDFEGDGAGDAVYADECFVRVYDGATGDVKYSAPRSSGTTYENPVVVDVDGDFHTEIVVGTNDYAGALGCPATDPLYPDAAYELSHGIRIYRDVEDRWVNSRPVWNQHAYSVTNVEDDGTIPATADWEPNWTVEGLNNFRQNVQGSLDPLAAPDFTAGGGDRELDCDDPEDPRIVLHVTVCNRGTESVDAGADVTFHDGDPEVAAPFCTTETTLVLDPGECEDVSCEWAPAPVDDPRDVTVVVDLAGEATECHEGNNEALIEDVTCLTVG